MNDILIRDYLEDDLQAVIALTAVWEGEQISIGVRADMPEDLCGCRIWVAEQGGQIVGFAAGREERSTRKSAVLAENERYFELEELYVLPEMRRCGIGDMLFAHAEAFARESGFSHMLLSTSTRDTAAMLRFYVQKQNMQVWSMRLFKEL